MEIPSIEDFTRIETKVDSLNRRLEVLLTSINAPQFVDINDIGRILRCSRSYLMSHKYLLPNCGVCETEGKMRWTYAEFENWQAKTEREKKAIYCTYLESVRKKGLKK